jgi:uncharacterized membrane protein YdjX (TVP38/TMEM64 family)
MRWTVLWVVIVALVLIPFFLFEDWFNALALQIASGTTSRRTAAALAAGLLTFDVFLPVPSSLVSAAAGVVLGFWPATALIWSSMTLACLLGYGFGRGAAGAARRFVGEPGIARATRLAADYGNYAGPSRHPAANELRRSGRLGTGRHRGTQFESGGQPAARVA